MDKKLINQCANASKEAYSKVTLKGSKTDTEVLIKVHSDHVIVAFRGTSSWKDVKQDLKRIQTQTKRGDIHSGFSQCCKEVYAQIYSKVAAYNMPVVFTGHSLGGAIAQVASTMFPFDSTCIVFGSPRVGDDRFCRYVEMSTGGKLLLVEHRLDRVPWMPYFGYSKPKKAIRKVWNWCVLATSAHSIDNYIRLVAKSNLS